MSCENHFALAGFGLKLPLLWSSRLDSRGGGGVAVQCYDSLSLNERLWTAASREGRQGRG